MPKRSCDKCGIYYPEDDLEYRQAYDEYICDSCADNEAEAAYERSLEGEGPETMKEQYECAHAEKKRL